MVGEVSTNGDTCLSHGATSAAFKKSDASSFTQISSDGFLAKSCPEDAVGNGLSSNAALRREGARIGEQADKRRQYQSQSKGLKKSTEFAPRQSGHKLVLPSIQGSRPAAEGIFSNPSSMERGDASGGSQSYRNMQSTNTRNFVNMISLNQRTSRYNA